MTDFRKLAVWDRSHRLTLRIYEATASFPKEERYGLSLQLRKSASSVPMNIAEGSRRRTDADFAHFLNIAEGSMGETEYSLLLARDRNYLSPDCWDNLNRESGEISAMLFAFRRTIERRRASRLVLLSITLVTALGAFLLHLTP